MEGVNPAEQEGQRYRSRLGVHQEATLLGLEEEALPGPPGLHSSCEFTAIEEKHSGLSGFSLGFRIPEEKGRMPTARRVSLSWLFKELETARWEKA